MRLWDLAQNYACSLSPVKKCADSPGSPFTETRSSSGGMTYFALKIMDMDAARFVLLAGKRWHAHPRLETSTSVFTSFSDYVEQTEQQIFGSCCCSRESSV